MSVELGYRFEEDGIEYLVCSVLNNLEMVSLPADMVAHVKQESGIEEILWPLGAYLIMQPSGLTLALFGRMDGKLVHRGGNFEPSTLGEPMWELWQELRDTPEAVIQENLKKMIHHTMLLMGVEPELGSEALQFFQGQLTRIAAEVLGVARSRVRSNLYFIDQGYVSAELLLDGKFLTRERHAEVEVQFKRYLATAKPN